MDKKPKPRQKTPAIRIETDDSNVVEIHPAERELRVQIGRKPEQKGLWATLAADVIDLGTDN